MTTGPVRILRIAAGGDGVGRMEDGRTVFVPRTAPGDLIEPVEVRLHARFARARVGRLLEPGPDRVEPACRHYDGDQCGGCQLQHLSRSGQETARRAIVGDALRRIGRLDLPDPPLAPAPSAWGYRTRVMLALDHLGRAGFHPLWEPEATFELEHCPVASDGINRLWLALRGLRDRWPADTRQIGLRQDREGGLHAILRSATRPESGLAPAFRSAGATSCWWENEGGHLLPMGMADNAAKAYPPAAFEQVNPEMGDRVRTHAIAELGAVEGCHVWDLYAGIGEATVLLAAAGATVESVELDAGAVALAARGGPAHGVRRRTGRVEDWLDRLGRPALVLCNPPRTGLGRAVTGGLIRAGAARIVYISCDPATLARDLVALVSGGYRVAAVAAFDLFPQTAHVETVVRLERE